MNERTSWFLVLLTSWLCFSCVVCNRENEVYLELIQKNENVFNFFNPELSRSKQLINRVLHDENRGLDKDCEDSLLSIYDGLEKKEAWALRCKTKPESCCTEKLKSHLNSRSGVQRESKKRLLGRLPT